MVVEFAHIEGASFLFESVKLAAVLTRSVGQIDVLILAFVAKMAGLIIAAQEIIVANSGFLALKVDSCV